MEVGGHAVVEAPCALEAAVRARVDPPAARHFRPRRRVVLREVALKVRRHVREVDDFEVPALALRGRDPRGAPRAARDALVRLGVTHRHYVAREDAAADLVPHALADVRLGPELLHPPLDGHEREVVVGAAEVLRYDVAFDARGQLVPGEAHLGGAEAAGARSCNLGFFF